MSNAYVPLMLCTFWCAGLLCSCEHAITAESTKEKTVYLYLGHIYQWHSPHENNRIDHRLESVDFDKYDGILLGGDICSETSKYIRTVEYVDDLFDIGAPTTLWSLGNHDVRNGNTQRITSRTGRRVFYTTQFDGIVWVVLNTSIDDTPDLPDPCALKETQWQLVSTVLDTISMSGSLVLLMHHVVWGDAVPGMRTDRSANADRPWFNFRCDSSAQFAVHVYPRLVEIQNAGINVFVISGDGGQYKKTYSHLTQDGITFLISGINNSVDTVVYPEGAKFSFDPDSLLLLEQNRTTGVLSYAFVPVDAVTD